MSTLSHLASVTVSSKPLRTNDLNNWIHLSGVPDKSLIVFHIRYLRWRLPINCCDFILLPKSSL